MTYGLHNLARSAGRQRRKRIGRGNASGHGSYSTRGQKGQRARTGGSQGIRRRAMKQLISHLPKNRGFRSIAESTVALDLAVLRVFANGALVTPNELAARGLIHRGSRVKFIGNGKLDRKLTVKAHGFSAAAKRGITESGGDPVVLPVRSRPRPRRRP